MSDASLSSWFRRSGAVRWGACFVLAIGFHGAGAAALMARWTDDNTLLPNSPAIMIDLAPIAVSPTDVQTDTPPDNILSKEEIVPDPTPEKPVEEVKAEPEPEKPPEKEQPPEPTPKPDLAVLPPPKVEKPKPKPKKKMASVAHTPTSAENRADHAAAPSPGANGNPNAVRNWTSELFSHISRYKRSVSDAQAGIVVVLSFAIDRSGGVHNVRVARSSGSSAFDQEAQAMVVRASPVPPPPPEKPGSQISITVPFRYSGRN